jgi:DNA primase catalytic core
MARIPEDEIERIKREVSLERLATTDGVELRRHGANLIGRCPFHEDKTPSLVITPQKNLWHCMGACQAGGSVIDWVMRSRSVSFRHAVEILRGDVLPTRRGRLAVLPSPLEPSADDSELLSQVVAYYHETLKESPEALGYLEKRGLRSDELIEHFRLGYANRTLGYRLGGSKERERLERLGIIRESGHEHFNGSLVVPILDEHVRVQGIYGRKIGPDSKLRKGTPLHLYLPGPHRGVFNASALAAEKTVILCEALLDALSFWNAGFRNVTSSYGIEGFTAAHLNAFRRHRTERVLIAYDRDEAGDRAAATLAERLMNEGLECLRVEFPHGCDANEYACRVKPASKSLGVLVASAAWIGKARRPMAPPDPEVQAAPPRRPEPANGGPPDELALKGLYSWRGRVLTKPVPKRSSDVLDEDLAANAEPVDGSSQGAAQGEAETPLARTGAPSLSLAALAAREELTASVAEPASAEGEISEARLDELAGEGRPLPSRVVPAPVPPSGAIETAHATAAPVSAGAVAPRPEHEELIVFEDRRYRVRGLDKNLAYDLLRVNVMAARGEAMHVDTLDLYSARQRAVFVKQAAIEMRLSEELVKRDIGRVICRLEELQHERITKALEPKTKDVEMSPAERERALALLEDPRLTDRILEDFAVCGTVGEETNKLLAYLATVSRKLEEPLAVIVQSSSSAGKSSLMEAVLALVPEEDRVKYSAMTGQSLFYMGETDLAHKILAIVEEAGAERATYALKLLQSEGELTIASTGKDPATGRMVTQEYRVCGPVMIFLTTTAVQVDEELLNRCLVLTVDEDREQTRAIHRLQRERQTLEGLLSRQERSEILALHRNAQRLVRPLLVVNPYAPRLTFLDDRTRTRRDHMKYLTLIRTIALLHQYQREVKTVEHRGKVVPYVEATLGDIALANRLAHRVLGRSLDELAPQTRQLLMLLDRMVAEGCERGHVTRRDYRFSRRQVREFTRWSLTQVHVQMSRLLEYEYVIQHRGGRGQSYEYELVYSGEGQNGEPFLAGLIDVEALAQTAELAPGEPSTTTTYPPQGATYPALEASYPGRFRPDSGSNPGGVQAPIAAPVLEETAKLALLPRNTHRGGEPRDDRRSTAPAVQAASGGR